MKPLTREFLLDQGSCCGNGCFFCPYTPRHTKGSTDTPRWKPKISINDILVYFDDGSYLEVPCEGSVDVLSRVKWASDRFCVIGCSEDDAKACGYVTMKNDGLVLILEES
jgi:hypothetical protein